MYLPRPSKGVKFPPKIVCFYWLRGSNFTLLEDSGKFSSLHHPTQPKAINLQGIWWVKGEGELGPPTQSNDFGGGSLAVVVFVHLKVAP